MSDVLIDKKYHNVKYFFDEFKPTFNSTNFFIKRDATIIPVWGYGIDVQKGLVKVNTRTKDNRPTSVNVLYNDELYFTTNVITMPGYNNTSNIVDMETVSIETLSTFSNDFKNGVFTTNQPLSSSAFSRVRKNKNSLYLNGENDHKLVFFHLDKKIKNIENESLEVIGQRNLVYFTIFNDEAVVQMLDLCLKSLHLTNLVKSFDVLIITDQYLKNKIINLPIAENFNILFHIMPSIQDSVEASMQKLKVFEFSQINNYKNILFLDADIVILQSIQQLFTSLDNVTNNETIQTVFNELGSPITHYHSLRYFTDDDIVYMHQKKLKPFNAGQFLFKNTLKMKKHFENIIWLTKAWGGYYFYEQSFLNYYFNVKTKLTSNEILHPVTKLNNYRGDAFHPYVSIVHITGGMLRDKVLGMRNALTKKGIII
jgi:hypothetical protein